MLVEAHCTAGASAGFGPDARRWLGRMQGPHEDVLKIVWGQVEKKLNDPLALTLTVQSAEKAAAPAPANGRRRRGHWKERPLPVLFRQRWQGVAALGGAAAQVRVGLCGLQQRRHRLSGPGRRRRGPCPSAALLLLRRQVGRGRLGHHAHDLNATSLGLRGDDGQGHFHQPCTRQRDAPESGPFFFSHHDRPRGDETGCPDRCGCGPPGACGNGRPGGGPDRQPLGKVSPWLGA